MLYRKIMIEDMTPGQIETLLEVKKDYEKLIKMGDKTEAVRARVNELNIALKPKEKSIKPKEW